MSRSREKNLVWIDLEMTGLDPLQDRILEIATIVTDSDLSWVEEGPSLAVHCEEDVLDHMLPVVERMHRENGLLERVRASSLTTTEAEELTLEFVKGLCGEHTAPLCGNSIWMDRMFLHHQMPRLENWMHYRIVDVSSIKELARRWRPSALASVPVKPETHRALDDIRASIEELRHYRAHFLRDAGGD